MYKFALSLVFIVSFHFSGFATLMLAEQYIQAYKDGAIAEMHKFGIPASITLAQGMLESANGNSDLAVSANNHFGIKCHNDWTGPTFIKDDDKKNECFRKYASVYDSFDDHSLFLTTHSRYAFLFELKTTDYKGWAHGLKQAGYATNPKYPDLLINLIERYELYKYDTDKLDKTVVAQKPKPVPTEKKVAVAKGSKKAHVIHQMGIKKYIIIQKGDTFYSIAKETDKDVWQLYKYNNLTEKDALKPGENLFLQPKRNRASVPYHTVKEGETMQSISQYYGIKLKALHDKNNMTVGDKPKVGTVLYMQKYKPLESY
jgi:LysM repeat protein